LCGCDCTLHCMSTINMHSAACNQYFLLVDIQLPINMHAAACNQSAISNQHACCSMYSFSFRIYTTAGAMLQHLCRCLDIILLVLQHAPSQSNHLCNLSMLGLRLRTCHGSGPRGRASLRVGEGVAITTPWQSGLRSSRGCSTFGLGCLSYRRAHWVLC